LLKKGVSCFERLSMNGVFSIISNLFSVRPELVEGLREFFSNLLRIDIALKAFGSCSHGNDREEKIRIPAGTCIQRRFAPKNLGRPIAQVVVQKRPAASKLVLEVRKPPAGWPWYS
jgi:hypothetical protein